MRYVLIISTACIRVCKITYGQRDRDPSRILRKKFLQAENMTHRKQRAEARAPL